MVHYITLRFMLYCVMMLIYAVLRYVMLCYAMLCLCYAMLWCYVVLCCYVFVLFCVFLSSVQSGLRQNLNLWLTLTWNSWCSPGLTETYPSRLSHPSVGLQAWTTTHDSGSSFYHGYMKGLIIRQQLRIKKNSTGEMLTGQIHITHWESKDLR